MAWCLIKHWQNFTFFLTNTAQCHTKVFNVVTCFWVCWCSYYTQGHWKNTKQWQIVFLWALCSLMQKTFLLLVYGEREDCNIDLYNLYWKHTGFEFWQGHYSKILMAFISPCIRMLIQHFSVVLTALFFFALTLNALATFSFHSNQSLQVPAPIIK